MSDQSIRCNLSPNVASDYYVPRSTIFQESMASPVSNDPNKYRPRFGSELENRSPAPSSIPIFGSMLDNTNFGSELKNISDSFSQNSDAVKQIWSNAENIGGNIWKGITTVGNRITGGIVESFDNDLYLDPDHLGENIVFGANSNINNIIRAAGETDTEKYKKVTDFDNTLYGDICGNGNDANNFDNINNVNNFAPNVPSILYNRESNHPIIEPFQTSQTNIIWTILLVILVIVVIYFIVNAWSKK